MNERKTLRAAEPRLSELETVVLGIVWKTGPCTPHAIRVHFLRSNNTRFSGSAGAIYPLVRRMEASGLLLAREDTSTRQRRKLYRISRAGLRSLRVWLASPEPDELTSILHDPIRLRVYFLGALTAGRRQALLDAAAEGCAERLRLLEVELEQAQEMGSTMTALAVQGSQAIARAQARWIQTVRQTLLEEGEDSE